MRLIDLKCPNCTAKLEVNADLKTIVCNYCGHQFILDDEIKHVEHTIKNAGQAGYDFELGRERAKQQIKNERIAVEQTNILNQQQAIADRQRSFQERLERQVEKANQSKWFLYMAIGTILSIIVPYLLPVVATILIWISPIEKINIKMVATLVFWVISAAIIGLTI